MHKKLKKTLIFTLSLAIGIFLIVEVYKRIPIKDVLASFTATTPLAVFSFIIVSIIMMMLHAWRWHIIIRTAGYHVPFYKTFMYKIIGFGISFITPFAKIGGEPLRAAMLQKQGLTFSEGLSTVVTDKTIDIATTGVMFSLAAVVAILTFTIPDNMKALLVTVSVIFILIISNTYYQLLTNKRFLIRFFKLFRLDKIKKLKKVEKQIIAFDQQIVDFHNKEREAFYKVLVLSIGVWLLMFLEYTTVMWILGYPATLRTLFLIITLMGAAYVFPIPLALGVFEAGQAGLFKAIGLQAAAGIGLTIIIRARDLMWTIIAIMILIISGIPLKRNKQNALKQEKLGKQIINKRT